MDDVSWRFIWAVICARFSASVKLLPVLIECIDDKCTLGLNLVDTESRVAPAHWSETEIAIQKSSLKISLSFMAHGTLDNPENKIWNL